MKAAQAFRVVFGTRAITDTEIVYVMTLAMDELQRAERYFCCYHVDAVRLARKRRCDIDGETVGAARDDWRRALAIARRLRENGADLDPLEAHIFVRQSRQPMAQIYPDLLASGPVADDGWRYLVKKDKETVRAYKMKAQARAFVEGCVFAGIKPKHLEITEESNPQQEIC